MTTEAAWSMGIRHVEGPEIYFVTVNGVDLGLPFGSKHKAIEYAQWLSGVGEGIAEALSKELEKPE